MSGRQDVHGSSHDANSAAAARPALAVGPLANEAGNNVGHEAVTFVAPSSYLRPRGHSRPSTPAVHKPMMTALDREQLEGLVSPLSVLSSVCPFLLLLWPISSLS